MPEMTFERPTRVLVTGATGYIGGHLVPRLLDAGAVVRTLTRRPGALRQVPWGDRVEHAVGDATSADDLRAALDGVQLAYYLLHSMDGSGDFVARDRAMAHTFARAAAAAGLDRIVYLGGLHPTDHRPPSPHLASRAEVGRIFLDGRVPAVILQAGVVLGAGSASFDMLRYLTGRLPVMVTPRWVHNRVQPIAIADVVHYLLAAGCADIPVDRGYDVSGPDTLTYAEMMQRYAAIAGLRRRLVLSVPVLTPALASHWVGAVTPVSSNVARPLMGSLIHDVTAAEDDLAELVPAPPGGRSSFEQAVRSALDDAPGDVVAQRSEAAVAVAGLLALPAAHLAQRLTRGAATVFTATGARHHQTGYCHHQPSTGDHDSSTPVDPQEQTP